MTVVCASVNSHNKKLSYR